MAETRWRRGMDIAVDSRPGFSVARFEASADGQRISIPAAYLFGTGEEHETVFQDRRKRPETKR